MKTPVCGFANKVIASLLAAALAAPLSYGAPLSPQQASQQQAAPAANSEVASNAGLPDAPAPQQQASPPQQQPAAPADQNNQNSGQKPVGTAVAPMTRPTGIAGSRPAGAAIAPAKQRRVRRILISVGILVGAGVAVGTVAGLSRASSSRP